MDNTIKEMKEKKEEMINQNVGLMIKNKFLKKKLATLTETNEKYRINNLTLKLLFINSMKCNK